MATAIYPTYTGVKYPETVWSDKGKTGSVTGTVTYPNGTGIAGAYVSIVNASNPSQEYYNTTSDVKGVYRIWGINATYSSVNWEGPDGTSATCDYGRGMYKMYANKSPYGEGYSDAYGIDADINGNTTTSVVVFPASSYVNSYGPQTVWSNRGKSGAVRGTVTTSINGTVGLAYAYVAIVNASNPSQEYCNTTSDANGTYVLTGLNATYSSVLGQGPDGTVGTHDIGRCMYKVYANKTPYGKGYSDAFGIDADGGMTMTSVVIFPKPASVVLTAERPYLSPNSSDNIRITATMYDALGNPVSDGYMINFTVDSATGTYDPRANGSLGYPDNIANFYQNSTIYNTGSTSAQFGWVNNTHGNDGTIVRAYWYDSGNPVASSLVNASIKIDYDTGVLKIVGLTVDTPRMNSSGSVKASYYLLGADPAGNDVQLVVYSSAGAMVRTIDAGVQASGPHDLMWDGRYSNGTYVPAGAYTLKAFAYSKDAMPAKLVKQWEFMSMTFGVAVNSQGNIIVTEPDDNATKLLYPNGTITTVGSGFNSPYGVAIDSRDNIYVADGGNNATKVIYKNGTIKTIGSGFQMPFGIAVDAQGNVYVVDESANPLKMIYPNGTTVALGHAVNQPTGVAVSNGNIYLADPLNGSVKKVCPDNTVVTLGGGMYFPFGVAVDPNDNIYVTDLGNISNMSFFNGSVYKIYPNNTTITLRSGLYMPMGVAVDPQGNVYVSNMYGSSVIEIFPDGSTATLRGAFNGPHDVAYDANGNIYVPDLGSGLGNGTIKVAYANGTVKTLYGGFFYTYSVAVDAGGNIYVADTMNEGIKVIHPNGVNETRGNIGYPHNVAIDGLGNIYAIDGYNRTVNKIYPNNTTIRWGSGFSYPENIAADAAGNVYVADFFNGVYKVCSDNTTMKLGNGFKFGYLEGIAVDASGNVYVADYGNGAVDMIQPDGTVVTLGTGFSYPIDVAISPGGNLCVLDEKSIKEFAPPLAVASDPVSINVTGGLKTFTFHLDQGWNLISFPIVPQDSNITNLIPSDARSHIFVIWKYDGDGAWSYWTELQGYTSTFGNIDVQHGYLVWCDNPVSFAVTGTPPSSDQISLVSGDYNIIGYPRQSSTDPASLYNDTLVVWGYKNGTWSYYTTLPGYTNSLASLDPGYGYEVYKS